MYLSTKVSSFASSSDRPTKTSSVPTWEDKLKHATQYQQCIERDSVHDTKHWTIAKYFGPVCVFACESGCVCVCVSTCVR